MVHVKPQVHLIDAGKLVAPKVIPKDIKIIKEDAPDMSANTGMGVPGGVAGGSLGGALGGIASRFGVRTGGHDGHPEGHQGISERGRFPS